MHYSRNLPDFILISEPSVYQRLTAIPKVSTFHENNNIIRKNNIGFLFVCRLFSFVTTEYFSLTDNVNACFIYFLNLGHIWQHEILFQTVLRLLRNSSFFSQTLSDALSSGAKYIRQNICLLQHIPSQYQITWYNNNYNREFLIQNKLIVCVCVFFCLFKNSLWSSERSSFFPHSSQKVFNVIAHIYSHV
jgi:hypothetical protein